MLWSSKTVDNLPTSASLWCCLKQEILSSFKWYQLEVKTALNPSCWKQQKIGVKRKGKCKRVFPETSQMKEKQVHLIRFFFPRLEEDLRNVSPIRQQERLKKINKIFLSTNGEKKRFWSWQKWIFMEGPFPCNLKLSLEFK